MSILLSLVHPSWATSHGKHSPFLTQLTFDTSEIILRGENRDKAHNFHIWTLYKVDCGKLYAEQLATLSLQEEATLLESESFEPALSNRASCSDGDRGLCYQDGGHLGCFCRALGMGLMGI